jgi:hypothetical protein
MPYSPRGEGSAVHNPFGVARGAEATHRAVVTVVRRALLGPPGLRRMDVALDDERERAHGVTGGHALYGCNHSRSLRPIRWQVRAAATRRAAQHYS